MSRDRHVREEAAGFVMGMIDTLEMIQPKPGTSPQEALAQWAEATESASRDFFGHKLWDRLRAEIAEKRRQTEGAVEN